MVKRYILVLAIISIAIMGMNSRAEAVPIGSGDFSGSATIIDFDALATGTFVDNQFAPDVVISDATGGAGGVVTFLAPEQVLSITESIRFTFGYSVYKVGLDFWSGSSPITLEVYDSSNALLEYLTMSSSGFLGISRTEVIAYAIVHDSGFGFTIDNLTFEGGAAPIPSPESSSLVLLGSGLVGFGILRWRKVRE